MVNTPEAFWSPSSEFSTVEAAGLTAAPSAEVTLPSRPTMKARSAPSRALRLFSAERMVGWSALATASRKPKSRDNSSAPSSSCCERSAQMRSNTVLDASSSRCTASSALEAMAA